MRRATTIRIGLLALIWGSCFPVDQVGAPGAVAGRDHLGPAGPRLGGAVRRRLRCSAVSMKARWRPWSVRLAGVSGNLGADVGGQRRKRGTGPAGLAGSAGHPARPEAFGCRAGPGQAPRRGTYDLKRHACRGRVPPAPTHRSPNLNRYVPHRGRSGCSFGATGCISSFDPCSQWKAAP